MNLILHGDLGVSKIYNHILRNIFWPCLKRDGARDGASKVVSYMPTHW